MQEHISNVTSEVAFETIKQVGKLNAQVLQSWSSTSMTQGWWNPMSNRPKD